MWFGLIMVIAAALVLAHRYVTGFDPGGATAPTPLIARVLAAIAAGIVPASMLAAAITHFSAARSMQYPVAGPLVVAVCLSAMLLLGAVLMGSEQVQLISQHGGFVEDRLLRTGSLRLYSPDRQGSLLSPLVVEEIGMTDGGGFSVVPDAVIDPRDGSLSIPGRPPQTVDLGALQNSYGSMAKTPEIVMPLISDARGLASAIGFTRTERLPSLLNLLALAFFGTSLWSLARLTKWPLFNMLFVLSALRFAAWVVPAIQDGALRDIVLGVFTADQLPLASAGVLAIVGLAFFAILVFLPPIADWRREVLGE